MTREEFIAGLREGITRRVSDPHPDDLVFTFVGTSARGLGVRPEILAYGDDGTKVYGLTRKQAVRLLGKLERRA